MHYQTIGPWTEERLRELSELVEKGLSSKAIGKIIGRTKNAVIGQCRRQGLTLKNKPNRPMKPKKEDSDEIIPLPKHKSSASNIIKFVPKDSYEAPIEASVSIMEKKDGQCPFIIGDPLEAICCGQKVVFGVYCLPHGVACYQVR